MEGCLAKELNLRYEPVAVLLSNEKPEGALQSKEDQWSCIIPLFIAAAKGKTAVFERKTTVCPGGKVGLGFGHYPENMPKYSGGIEYHLSTGKDGFDGEGYKKSPELGREFVECLPITDIPYQYVIFKPMSQVDIAQETPEIVSFYINSDQLSALTVLANYYRPGTENVIIPFSSGCQNTFLVPYAEAQKENPRAVVGLTDLSVRLMVEPNMLSFSVPYKMFLDMEKNIKGSFLEKNLWQKIVART